MGLKPIDRLFASPTIALDTNVFIYALEGNQNFPLAIEFFQLLSKRKNRVYTSILSVLETVVPLYTLNREDKIATYLEFIHGQGLISVIAIDRSIALKATQYRSKFKLKTPDAIQLATATLNGAGIFITADRGFKMQTVEKVKIEII